jgi:PAS domain-containing protein
VAQLSFSYLEKPRYAERQMRFEKKCGTSRERLAKGDLIGRIMQISLVALTATNRAEQVTFANAHTERLPGLANEQIPRRSYNAPEWHITAYQGRSLVKEELMLRRARPRGRPAHHIGLALEGPDGQRDLSPIDISSSCTS